MTALETYLYIGRQLPEATESQFFGKPCFKANGKAFIAFFQEAMVFKLKDVAHRRAIAMSDAQLFDPSGKKRPMKEWVQVPFAHAAQWHALAEEAMAYVASAKE